MVKFNNFMNKKDRLIIFSTILSQAISIFIATLSHKVHLLFLIEEFISLYYLSMIKALNVHSCSI